MDRAAAFRSEFEALHIHGMDAELEEAITIPTPPSMDIAVSSERQGVAAVAVGKILCLVPGECAFNSFPGGSGRCSLEMSQVSLVVCDPVPVKAMHVTSSLSEMICAAHLEKNPPNVVSVIGCPSRNPDLPCSTTHHESTHEKTDILETLCVGLSSPPRNLCSDIEKAHSPKTPQRKPGILSTPRAPKKSNREYMPLHTSLPCRTRRRLNFDQF